MSLDYIVDEETTDHKYRTEIPNIVMEMLELEFLSPYDLVVYTVLKKIAGDHGKSTCSIPTLSKKCGCSENRVRDSLKNLEKHIEFIKLPLIRVYEEFDEKGSAAPNKITIVDIWRKNGDYYKEKYPLKKELDGSNKQPRVIKKFNKGGSGNEPGVVQEMNQGGSAGEPKEEPLNKNHFEEQLTNSFPSKEKESERVSDKDDEEKLIKRLKEAKFINRSTGQPEKFTEDEIERYLIKYSIDDFFKSFDYIRSQNEHDKSKIISQKAVLLHVVKNKPWIKK